MDLRTWSYCLVDCVHGQECRSYAIIKISEGFTHENVEFFQLQNSLSSVKPVLQKWLSILHGLISSSARICKMLNIYGQVSRRFPKEKGYHASSWGMAVNPIHFCPPRKSQQNRCVDLP